MICNRAKSNELQRRASIVMPLGVNSNVRYWGKDQNLFLKRAKGAYVWDMDDNRYIDYRLAFGPVILGYAFDEVDQKVYEAIKKGVTVGLTSEAEIEVAEKMIEMIPGVEMVRLVNSGTEATMHALRIARAYTGREKIIKFEGGYHGGHDYVLFSTYAPPEAYGSRRSPIPIPASSGIPRCLADLVITLPFNDPDLLDSTLHRIGHEVAAIITEPMLGNFGSVDPQPGFLEFIRNQCNQYGIVFLMDEVKTGFRIARGGAQEAYGIIPDMVTYAKSLGNGYPVAAFGGRADIMSIIGRGVTQGGTYAGNAVGVAAANATLEILQTQPVVETITELGRTLQEGIRSIFQDAGIPILISKHPTIFSISFGINHAKDAREWVSSDRTSYRKFFEKALELGVLIDEDPREPWCLCYSHSKDDIDHTLDLVNKIVHSL